MTQPLETLKKSLQNALTQAQANCEYNMDWQYAINDGIYSCDLSVVGLEQWINIWKTAPLAQLGSDEVFYLYGVQFVADKWDEINVVEVGNVC